MKITTYITKDKPEISDSKRCEILAVGDTAPARLPLTGKHDFNNVFSDDVLSILHDKDISCVNLECPLTTVEEAIVKSGPNLSARPETVEILQKGRFDIAALANNHIMDYGPKALEETILTCNKAGIKTVGVGSDLQSAYRPVIVEVKGMKIAFLAFAEEEFSCATSTTPGAAKLDPINAATVIRDAKTNADLVVVNVHGGSEYYPIPSPRTQKWYRFLVDCGANAVIGNHPHCIQGMEVYKETPICYSLGNFLFPARFKRPECWYEGLILKLCSLSSHILSASFFPVRQVETDGGIKIESFPEERKSHFKRRLQRLNQISSETSLVEEFWKCFCSHRKKNYVNILKMATNGMKGDIRDLIKSTIKSGDVSHLPSIGADYFSYLFSRKSLKKLKLARLKNLLICPAHHEVLSTIVEMERLSIIPAEDVKVEFRELMRECQ